ncbi:sugar ABC transporter permease [Devosia rhodophyticola]|uniref:Sugar ABC transporter permease n=1 Tax=Devosia rhodophyticola TaxID=3026423 RepID=A0ABY7YZJ8_9HYPH|nr:sugar ABC transporter permease [Devosia rhodophyticola]WDR06815.1 sugar ABC transporter permease [Devosia rhodophyticola]
MAMTYEARLAWQNRLLLLPGLVLLIAFVLIPAGTAIWLSLTNEALNGAAALNPRFVGARNYVRLFTDGGFWNSLFVTFVFVIGSSVIGQFVLGLFAAVALNRPLAFRQVFMAAILLPNAVPEVVAGFIWISMLAGGEHSTLSQVLAPLGVPSQQWLQSAPLLMIIVVNTWRGIAFAMILMTSGLAAIPADVYEAARMDGATARQIFWRITLPLLRPTIFLYMLVSTVGTFAIFGLIYTLTRGGPGGATEIIGIYIYNQSFTAYQLGFGSAVAVVMLAISALLGALYVRILKVEV